MKQRQCVESFQSMEREIVAQRPLFLSGKEVLTKSAWCRASFSQQRSDGQDSVVIRPIMKFPCFFFIANCQKSCDRNQYDYFGAFQSKCNMKHETKIMENSWELSRQIINHWKVVVMSRNLFCSYSLPGIPFCHQPRNHPHYHFGS